MSYALTEELDRLVQQKLASGRYASAEAVLREALSLLDEKEAIIAAVAEGYEDMQAGRHRPFDEADAEFCRRHGIVEDA